MYQKSMRERREMLCPALWLSPSGWFLIQAAASKVSAMMSIEEYCAMGSKWSHAPGDDEEAPFEPKASDWGWYDGRIVAVDYANHESLYEIR
jgi:hypothetical protein